MSSKQVIRGTFGQKGDNWYSYFKTPEGRHAIIESSKVIGSTKDLGSFLTKRELVKFVNEMQIELA